MVQFRSLVIGSFKFAWTQLTPAPILQMWINLNPKMDKYSQAQ